MNRIINEMKEEEAKLEESCSRNKREDEEIQIKFNDALTTQNSCRLKNIKSREEILKMEHQLN